MIEYALIGAAFGLACGVVNLTRRPETVRQDVGMDDWCDSNKIPSTCPPEVVEECVASND